MGYSLFVYVGAYICLLHTNDFDISNITDY